MPDTAPAADIAPVAATPRRYGAVNALGVWTLYKREVGRFMKVWMQTLFAPVVTTLLFMTVFKLAFGDRGQLTGDFQGLVYNDFLAPGLIIMAVLQNAFQNTSSSLVQAKFNGTHVDFLMPPLSPLELTAAFIGGAVTRGLLVAVVAGSGSMFQAWRGSMRCRSGRPCGSDLRRRSRWARSGRWAGSGPTSSTIWRPISNFVIVPLTFLSGTFYDIKVMVEPFYTLALFDPLFYFIDGFRYGFLGVANSDIQTGVIVSGVLAAAGVAAVWAVFRTGWKLKA